MTDSGMRMNMQENQNLTVLKYFDILYYNLSRKYCEDMEKLRLCTWQQEWVEIILGRIRVFSVFYSHFTLLLELRNEIVTWDISCLTMIG